MFENLELAEFGNRIPFLTFEVLADAAPPAIATVLADSSGEAIRYEDSATLLGYAAYGKSVASAVAPLVTSFGIELFDDGELLRGSTAEIAIADDELGNNADGEVAARIQREQPAARSLPAALRLSYYEPARDYQAGEARAAVADETGPEEQRDLPAVLAADEAKTLVQTMLARSWAERDRLTLRLPPSRLGLEPGSRVELDLRPRRWTVTQCTVEGMVMVAELRPATGTAAPIAGEAGRVLAMGDVVEGPVTMALIDAATLGETTTEPTVLLAASSETPGWRPRAFEARFGSQRIAARTARRKAVIGATADVLPAADPTLVDGESALDVTLIDPDQWLLSCDGQALDEGANLALVGKELIQFGKAAPIGPGQFRLSRLRRGLRGTEEAIDEHVAGEVFLLIERDALKPIALPSWVTGRQVSVICGERTAEATVASKPNPASIADPSGGVTADSEARAAIAQMLSAMRQHGLIEP